ncbi:BBM_1a_G0025470.mRNA.1.CDS.1 [Saccharomyces cerevisiae]|nr:BBM_1a_G0025470.mRNA.1.CDS.1 [Saccharomyces cerevisiae]CAI7086978.1 BBM_1a_G0025470.mRNA.1.CDS.1 [Saccharomyces cerevisiae]
MHLFLNEAYIYHRFLCECIVLWCLLCILMWGKVRMPIIGVPRCLKKPFLVPVKFPFSVEKNI